MPENTQDAAISGRWQCSKHQKPSHEKRKNARPHGRGGKASTRRIQETTLEEGCISLVDGLVGERGDRAGKLCIGDIQLLSLMQ